MPAPTKLLLWDIDGTLIHSGKAGEDAFAQAMHDEFGIDTSLHVIDYRGRTDRRISHLMLEHHGLPRTPENIHRLVESYLGHLAAILPQRQGGLYPGIGGILEAAHHRPDLVNALLTGNMVRGAQLKLGHYQVWHYFEFGAFADDSDNRNDLGPVALRRALEDHGLQVTPEHTFVIGDTPHDVACGQVIGARTLAVATGAFSVEELRACGPTAVFADFSDPAAFFAVIDAA